MEVTYDDIDILYFFIRAEYWENSIFLMHDAAAAMALRVLKDANGQLLWNSPGDTIFGKSVISSRLYQF